MNLSEETKQAMLLDFMQALHDMVSDQGQRVSELRGFGHTHYKIEYTNIGGTEPNLGSLIILGKPTPEDPDRWYPLRAVENQ